jgi:DNA polymerase-3 subunit alpha
MELSNEINNTDKVSVFVGECKRMGISILPPDVNRSGLKFTPESNTAVPAVRQNQPADSQNVYVTPESNTAVSAVRQNEAADRQDACVTTERDWLVSSLFSCGFL